MEVICLKFENLNSWAPELEIVETHEMTKTHKKTPKLLKINNILINWEGNTIKKVVTSIIHIQHVNFSKSMFLGE